MKTKYRFISLVGSLVCLGGGVSYADAQFTPDDLSESPSITTNPAPSVQGPESRMRYTIKSVPPSPMVDYKIGRITPDPTIDYRIMIAGPRLELTPVGIDTRKEELTLENE